MADGSSIEWTDATWNPTRGCSRVSAGCEHCYAEGVARRFSGPGQPYEGLVRIDRDGKAKAQWNGVVRLVDDHLFDPLRWTRPRKVFVNSMSDLFHEALAFEDIAAIFGVMAACSQHTFQVLTKRPERAREFFAWVEAQDKASGVEEHGLTRGLTECVSQALSAETRIHPEGDGGPLHVKHCGEPAGRWPLPNVWIGVSVENQETADARIPILLELPAAVRFVSYEPALGPVNFRHLFTPHDGAGASGLDALAGDSWFYGDEPTAAALARPSESDLASAIRSWPGPDLLCGARLNWIIAGGESGPRARPCALEWLQSAVEQCRAAGVPVFVKQLGAHVVSEERSVSEERARELEMQSRWAWRAGLRDRKGGDPAEWPADLHVRQFPEATR